MKEYSGVERLDRDTYISTRSDAQFTLDSFWLKHFKGWLRLHIYIKSSAEIDPKIYLDYGHGFNEGNSVVPVHTKTGLYQAELVLTSSVKALRLGPCKESNVEFELTKVVLVLQNELMYILKQFLQVIFNDFKKKIYPLRIVEKSYARYKKHGRVGMLERLEKEYNKLHPHNVLKNSTSLFSYQKWIKKNEIESYHTLPLEYNPLISVLIPTYNTPIDLLKKCLNSVLQQSYKNFEISIADDASSSEETRQILQEYEKSHKNIVVTYRKKNGHISMATNSALKRAQGEYVAFLDHDDILAPNALYEVVKALNQNRDLVLIYSDEDKIDLVGNRFDPHFKPGWNPDMFYSHNYISHFSVVKRSRVEEVDGLRAGYEGAQDYDLLLRVLDGVDESQIAHIEKILYHWRAVEGSTALDASEKSYTTEAGLKSLEDYFSKKNVQITVEKGSVPNTYKVNYPLPAVPPLVSILIPTRDGFDILSKCVASILKYTKYKNYEIIILDNETTDQRTLDYFDELGQYKKIRIVEYHFPFNYSAINNFGVKHAKGEIIALLNNDVEIISYHWLTEMVQHALRPDIGAVGAMLYYDNNTIQHAGVILGVGGVANHSHKFFKRGSSGYFARLLVLQNYSAVTAACLVIRKEIYSEVGGLEEELKVAFNDVDFCLKVQEQGYRNLWTPYAELYHHESISRGLDDDDVKRKRALQETLYMKEKWKNKLEKDFYYNKNLTQVKSDFGLNI